MVAHHEVEFVVGYRPNFAGQYQVLVHEPAGLVGEVQKPGANGGLSRKLGPQHADHHIERIVLVLGCVSRGEQSLPQYTTDPVRAANGLENRDGLLHVENQPFAARASGSPGCADPP